ncbi:MULTISPECIES: YcjF family protein [Microbacterium]|uniref:YcjF family protein n=1 Tax=Microbacterium TaxID=33882 RepID=UPI0012B6D463|nr:MULTISPECIES: DUF697 domain-containing protein [Microbacterium]MTE24431.1 DUF697 domain-containing protein [Microbacterium sp. ZXX196]NHI16007.1 DUF697 domain-containing protein [Microbacterium excoecariae]
MNDTNEAFVDAHDKARRRYGRFNLAVVGGTGVGKSSLVNAVFGRDLARVGKGLPVTEGVHYYHDDVLGIWDVEGFEIGTATSPAEALRGHLARIAARPAEEQISVVWYCVAARADRLTNADVAMIRELDAAGLPVILVLTKVEFSRHPVTGSVRLPRDVAEFRDWLVDPRDHDGNRIPLPVHAVIPTAAHGPHGKGAGPGLGELVAETLALSPEDEKDAFRVAQRLNLPWKRKMARPIIAAAAASAAAATAVPLPVADATALAPIQVTMMAKIAAVYDLKLTSMLSTSTIAQLSAQITGQALARSFLKLIPGAGSVIGSSVAFALTYAMGEAWVRVCERVQAGKLDLARVGDAWEDLGPSAGSVIREMATKRIRRG